MATVKDVHIEGLIPFNTDEHDELNTMLGQLNAPNSGLRITYSPEVVRFDPNSDGGDRAIFRFGLSGEEAVSFAFLDRFKALVESVGGTIEVESVKDLEA